MANKTMARKMLSKLENKTKPIKTPIFQSKNWDLRKEAIATRVKNKITKVRKAKMERLAKLELETGKEVSKKKNKLSVAEQKQIRRKVKIAKFKAKLGLKGF